MDAHNLALCITPNLVKSNDPIRDVKICAVPGAASMTNATWNTPGAAPKPGPTPAPPRKAGTTTLGDIVRVCIERYFEIFEDVPDRGDALPVPVELKFENEGGMSPSLSGSSLTGGSSTSSASTFGPSSGLTNSSISTLESAPRSSMDIEDDELNEAMLVMSVAPQPEPSPTRSPRTGNAMARSTGALAPSAWSRSPKLGSGLASPALGLSPGKPSLPLASPTIPTQRHRRTPSSNSATFSVAHTTGQGSSSGLGSTIRGARSAISIEKQAGLRKGSIALGRSGGAGASGVAAMGVTANGFFERPT